MPAKHLEASVRLKPGGTVLDLRGEINGFAQEALNAAYTEANAKDPGAIILEAVREGSNTGESPQHQATHDRVDHGLATLAQPLVVLAHPSALRESQPMVRSFSQVPSKRHILK